MLGAASTDTQSNTPMTDSTIKRRMDNYMSDDIEQQLTEKMQESGKFSLQIDESTDIVGAAQLLANVRYVDGDYQRDFSLLQRNGKPYNDRWNIQGNW